MIFPRMHRYQQLLKNDTGSSNLTENSRVITVGGEIEVNVFFDGTLNNYYNSKDYRGKGINKGTSYTNGYSNVAHLWMRLEGMENAPDKFKVYIDGAGTIRHRRDVWNIMGSAFAWGETGIEDRVQEAFDLIKGNQIIKRGNGIALKLNVYGFSRGAAYARYFIHLAKTQPKKFGGTINSVEVNFVGIFDTVPAEGGSAKNDVSEFHLKLEHGKKVVHLTAKNEYRANFRLTNINAAVARGAGFELELPGAHSDIGGGYEEVAPESHEFYCPYSGDGSLRPFFLSKGFYNENDMGRYHTPAYGHNTLKGKRLQILNAYQYVSLAIMQYCAKTYAKAQFTPNHAVEKIFSADPALKDVRNQFLTIAKNRSGTAGRRTLSFPENNARYLTYNYLHVSFEAANMANYFDYKKVDPNNPVRYEYDA